MLLAVAQSRIYSCVSELYGSWRIHRIENEHLGDGMHEFWMRGGINEVSAKMKGHFKSFKQ